MSQHTISCSVCRYVWTYTPPLSRRDECPSCRRDARICLNCQHYDKAAHHHCREDQAEFVPDKEMGNFCSYFAPRSTHARQDEAARVKGQLNALFRGEEPARDASAPKSLTDELARFLASKK